MYLKISCRDQLIGEDSVKVQSRLSQLRSLLQDIADPMSLMCEALGLDNHDSGALDKHLAQQVQKQWTSQLTQMFQTFDSNSPGKLK